MTDKKFECWAIIELFGHQRMAGLVTEATIGGCSFVRVDVPVSPEEGASHQFITRFLGNGAIYALNPVSEAIAREAANVFGWVPVNAYELPKLMTSMDMGPQPSAETSTGEPDLWDDAPQWKEDPGDPNDEEGLSIGGLLEE